MNKTKKIFLKLLAVFAVISLCFACKKEKETVNPRDFQEIKKSGILKVAFEYNSIGFYVDGDTVSGYHYDMIQSFAAKHGLKVKAIPLMSNEDRTKGLEDGKFDIIAYSIPITNATLEHFLIAKPLIRNKQVLIQRKQSNENDSTYIHTQIELGGCTLYVEKESPAIFRIQNLSNEIGDTIFIKEIEKYGPEQLIDLVAHGDIDYAVCNEMLAKKAALTLPQIDVNKDISFNQFYSWAVNKQSPILLDSINHWITTETSTKEYQKLYNKYFKFK